MIVECTTRFCDTGADSYRGSSTLCLVKPKDTAALDRLYEQAMKKTNGYITWRATMPHRPRSTGPRSQNSRVWGHSEDLAEQVVGKDGLPAYTKRQIHDAMLRMSVPEGYPTCLDINGAETPLPDEQTSVEQLDIVLKVQQRYADIHNFWLHEYVAEGPHKGEVYKSVGGRTYEEMERYREGK